MNIDEIKYSLQNLANRKLRSGLTVLSILIGITAIFALVSFGFGIQSYIDEIAAEAGVDKLFIQSKGVGAPGTDDTFAVTQNDVDFVNKINGVKEISGMYMKSVEVKRNKEIKYVFGAGVDETKLDFVEESFTVGVDYGRQFRKGDNVKVVLGHNYRKPDKIFEKPVELGEKIEINGVKFDVVGFYEEIGNPQDDSTLYLTYKGFETLFPDSKDTFAWIMIKADKNVQVSKLADTIKERLRKHKDQEKGQEDFFVQTFEDALETFNSIIAVLNGILFLIALISLIVASVNTMNTMYTAVVERTKEIGIMKAIGARNSDIMLIFIFEAGAMGLVGGVLGVALGWLIASTGGAIAASAGFSSLQPIFPFSLIMMCILFSFGVGALSGILPAKAASKLKPIEALRYE